jgi:hypothetical protein
MIFSKCLVVTTGASAARCSNIDVNDLVIGLNVPSACHRFKKPCSNHICISGYSEVANKDLEPREVPSTGPPRYPCGRGSMVVVRKFKQGYRPIRPLNLGMIGFIRNLGSIGDGRWHQCCHDVFNVFHCVMELVALSLSWLDWHWLSWLDWLPVGLALEPGGT